MNAAGAAILAMSIAVIIVAGIGGRWQFWGPQGRSSAWLLTMTALGIVGVVLGLLLLALS
jgi:hypothetical protein